MDDASGTSESDEGSGLLSVVEPEELETLFKTYRTSSPMRSDEAVFISACHACRHRNARASPIYRLPIELFLMIIAEALPGGADRLPRLCELSSVASHWRNVIISMASLWTEIHGWERPLLLALALERSGSAPLTIGHTEMKINTASEYREIHKRLLDAIVPHIARWKSASFVMERHTAADTLSAPAPLLRRIQIQGSRRYDYSTAMERIFADYAPLLEDVTVKNVGIDIESPVLSGLKKLFLHHTCRRVSRKQLLSTLAASPGLEEFYIEDDIMLMDEDITCAPIVNLPLIRTFSITMASTLLPSLDGLLSRIRIPNVTRFHLTCEGFEDPSSFLSLSDENLRPIFKRILSTAHNVELIFDEDEPTFAIKITTEGGQEYELRILFELYVIEPLGPWLVDLLNSTRRPTVISLHVYYMEFDDAHIECWSQLENITELGLYYPPRGLDLIKRLGAGRLVDGVMEWALPRLTHMTLWMEASAEEVLKMVTARARARVAHEVRFRGSGSDEAKLSASKLPDSMTKIEFRSVKDGDLPHLEALRTFIGEGKVTWS